MVCVCTRNIKDWVSSHVVHQTNVCFSHVPSCSFCLFLCLHVHRCAPLMVPSYCMKRLQQCSLPVTSLARTCLHPLSLYRPRRRWLGPVSSKMQNGPLWSSMLKFEENWRPSLLGWPLLLEVARCNIVSDGDMVTQQSGQEQELEATDES